MNGNNNKKITVVIASYKYGHLAAHCIESILSQTRIPDRILFVDDGIGDCNHLPKIYKNVEYVLRKKNLGTVHNFQDMLDRVDTELCLFVGADNWLRSDAIEKLLLTDADIVTYDIIVTGEIKDEIYEGFSEDMYNYQGDYYWKRNGLHHGSMMYNVAKAKKIGYKKLREGHAYTSEDLNLWNGMLADGATVEYIKEGLLYYRRHKENYNKYGKYYKSKDSDLHPIIKKIKKIYYKIRYNYTIVD
ncbi:glycosyltransferase [Kaistella haifensis]|uniref:glycosyltransferase family 2 protein n=1 Tax=Kaistella sp. TaxID=2782235 RepID=UPI000F45049E|nr:glycosyltransferase [Kaistella haifensis]